MNEKKVIRYNLISNAYTSMKKGDKDISILDTEIISDMATQNAILDIQRDLDAEFELSYEIMAEACSIINELDMNELSEADFFAEADSRANVYTYTQLSYLNVKNEAEISDLIKDEAITSIAQACSIWYSQKVSEACQALSDYIMQA